MLGCQYLLQILILGTFLLLAIFLKMCNLIILLHCLISVPADSQGTKTKSWFQNQIAIGQILIINGRDDVGAFGHKPQEILNAFVRTIVFIHCMQT